MSFLVIDIVVNGEFVKANVADELEISDISSDMDKVASQIAYWGNIWAEADKEEQTAKAYYRNWKAITGNKFVEDNEKLAEWKVRQQLEALDEFRTIKEGLARASKNVLLAKSVYEAFKAKANILQSKGAMMRAELDSTSMKTKDSKKSIEEKRSNAKIKLKKVLRKNK